MKISKFMSIVGMCFFTGVAVAAPLYTITEVTPIGDWFSAEYPNGMNASGQVAGYGPIKPGSNFPSHAMLFGNGRLSDLGTLNSGAYSIATGINRLGQVVGYAETGPGTQHAFLYTNGSLQDLGTLGGGNSNASAINDSGQVVGMSQISGSSCLQAFTYANGVMRPTGTCESTYNGKFLNNRGDVAGVSTTGSAEHTFFSANGTSVVDVGCLFAVPCPKTATTYAMAMNSAGAITGYSSVATGGYHAFLARAGQIIDLGTLGGTYSMGYAINASGDVTGYSEVSGQMHAFLYSKGKIRDLGTLGGGFSLGLAVNSDGKVVGVAKTAIEDHAFLFSEGRMFDLNELITPKSPLKGIVKLVGATAITDNGYILAIGDNSLSGVHTAYVLKPIN